MMTVRPSMFGDVTIADGAIHLMDGGVHGVQGHTLVIPPEGAPVTWARRIDSVQPSGKVGSGTLTLTADEATSVASWSAALWALALKGTASWQNMADGAPRWVWAIVLRRGDEVRVLTGGSITPTRGAPDPAEAALRWLIDRVDAESMR